MNNSSVTVLIPNISTPPISHLFICDQFVETTNLLVNQMEGLYCATEVLPKELTGMSRERSGNLPCAQLHVQKAPQESIMAWSTVVIKQGVVSSASLSSVLKALRHDLPDFPGTCIQPALFLITSKVPNHRFSFCPQLPLIATDPSSNFSTFPSQSLPTLYHSLMNLIVVSPDA